VLNASKLNRTNFVSNRQGDNKDQRSVYSAESDRQEQRLPVVNGSAEEQGQRTRRLTRDTRNIRWDVHKVSENKQAFKKRSLEHRVEASTREVY